MSASASAVLVCALDLLGQSARQFAPISIIPTPPPGVSANADAFVNRADGRIYLIASGPWFRLAEEAQRTRGTPALCVERHALKVVASIIVHEQWHLTHGPDEKGAYEAQLSVLNRLGLGSGTWVSAHVTRAMQTAIARQNQATGVPPALAARR